ncbi:hypothetical protein [Deinococcus misasensis]|uniref:hypothetical protein n=1 Tax=Deinococcus misasensis TaxID=392413 RepID=UPI00054DC719|nr:hypothetical protein [Deinococcus misasensis]
MNVFILITIRSESSDGFQKNDHQSITNIESFSSQKPKTEFQSNIQNGVPQNPFKTPHATTNDTAQPQEHPRQLFSRVIHFTCKQEKHAWMEALELWSRWFSLFVHGSPEATLSFAVAVEV